MGLKILERLDQSKDEDLALLTCPDLNAVMSAARTHRSYEEVRCPGCSVVVKHDTGTGETKVLGSCPKT